MTGGAEMSVEKIEAQFSRSAGVEGHSWVSKILKWTSKWAFTHSNLETPLELLLIELDQPLLASWALEIKPHLLLHILLLQTQQQSLAQLSAVPRQC